MAGRRIYYQFLFANRLRLWADDFQITPHRQAVYLLDNKTNIEFV